MGYIASSRAARLLSETISKEGRHFAISARVSSYYNNILLYLCVCSAFFCYMSDVFKYARVCVPEHVCVDPEVDCRCLLSLPSPLA